MIGEEMAACKRGENTRGGVRTRTDLRHLGAALALCALAWPQAAAAQTPPWREAFAAGQQALALGDLAAYHQRMAEAAGSMPEGALNRPFVQYHAARAAALTGRTAEAVRWLRTAWDEDIEALMITFAAADSAFDAMREDAGFRETMALPAGMALGVRSLDEGVWLITGAGANLLLLAGGGEALLVDTGYGPALPALRRALAEAGAPAVTHVLLSHPHEDHMGSAAELGAGATVLAHPGTATAMAEPYVFIEGVELPPKPAAAMPDVEIASDTTLVLAGREVRIVPLEAHTGADLAVYLPGAGVAHLGDAYLAQEPMMFPGSEDPEGFLARFEAFLDSMAEGTVVLSGHGEAASIDDVRGQIAETRACMRLVREALAEGLDAQGAARRAEGRFPPQWVAFFHRVLGSG